MKILFASLAKYRNGLCRSGRNAIALGFSLMVPMIQGCVLRSNAPANLADEKGETPQVPVLNFNAPLVYEYHEVKPEKFGAFTPGIVVSTEHFHKVANQYSANKNLFIFDDGYASVYEHAFPILQEFKIPAAVALIRGAIAEAGFVPVGQHRMTRAQIQELLANHWVVMFHASSVAEHELNYKRFAEILELGTTEGNGQQVTFNEKLSDEEGAASLQLLTNLKGPSFLPVHMELYRRLASGRKAVLAAVAQNEGSDAALAASEYLGQVFSEEKRKMEDLLNTSVAMIVYPHSENNQLVRQAAARAGFTKGFAGGPIGEPGDPFNIPRRYMNEGTSPDFKIDPPKKEKPGSTSVTPAPVKPVKPMAPSTPVRRAENSAPKG